MTNVPHWYICFPPLSFMILFYERKIKYIVYKKKNVCWALIVNYLDTIFIFRSVFVYSQLYDARESHVSGHHEFYAKIICL